MLAEGEKSQDHPITEADKGTVTLRATLKRLEQQIESIEKQIERYVTLSTLHLPPRPFTSFNLIEWNNGGCACCLGDDADSG